MIRGFTGKGQVHPDSYRDGRNIGVEFRISSSLNRHFRAAEENLRLGQAHPTQPQSALQSR
jgi:hypothetical protein